MGQRSQIYVRIGTENGPKTLIPRYYQWNFGTRMISRARYTMEWLKDNRRPLLCCNGENAKKLKMIMDTNFDYKDVVLGSDIISEFWDLDEEMSDEAFRSVVFHQDNNDGQLFIDVIVTETEGWAEPDIAEIKYAFFTSRDCDYENPLTGKEYIKGYDVDSEEVDFTIDNLKWIGQNATLMTKEEAFAFYSYDYFTAMGIATMVSEDEFVYRRVKMRYLKEDAERHLQDYLEMIEDDDAYSAERTVIKEMLSFRDYCILAEKFENRRDGNVADNDIWNSVISDYIKSIVKAVA